MQINSEWTKSSSTLLSHSGCSFSQICHNKEEKTIQISLSCWLLKELPLKSNLFWKFFFAELCEHIWDTAGAIVDRCVITLEYHINTLDNKVECLSHHKMKFHTIYVLYACYWSYYERFMHECIWFCLPYFCFYQNVITQTSRETTDSSSDYMWEISSSYTLPLSYNWPQVHIQVCLLPISHWGIETKSPHLYAFFSIIWFTLMYVTIWKMWSVATSSFNNQGLE